MKKPNLDLLKINPVQFVTEIFDAIYTSGGRVYGIDLFSFTEHLENLAHKASQAKARRENNQPIIMEQIQAAHELAGIVSVIDRMISSDYISAIVSDLEKEDVNGFTNADGIDLAAEMQPGIIQGRYKWLLNVLSYYQAKL